MTGLVRYAYPASVGLATEASDRKEIIIRGQASVACGLLDAEKALCLSFLNMQEDDGFLRQQDEITPESCPSPQFMVGADFSPVSASKNNSLPTVLVTPENNSQLMPAQQVLRGKGSPGDKDCISNRTVSTLATQDSEAGIYTPIVYSRGSFE